MHSKKVEKEISELMLEIAENQKALEKEIDCLRDNMRAQNTLSKEMLKIHKLHKDMAEKNAVQLERIERILSTSNEPRT